MKIFYVQKKGIRGMKKKKHQMRAFERYEHINFKSAKGNYPSQFVERFVHTHTHTLCRSMVPAIPEMIKKKQQNFKL